MERLTEYVTENCSKPFYRFRSDGEIDIRYRYCINIEKAIDKLAEYENTGLEPKEVNQLKHDLAVRDNALELALISRKKMLEKENCFTCSVEKAKIEFLDQAEEALRKLEEV